MRAKAKNIRKKSGRTLTTMSSTPLALATGAYMGECKLPEDLWAPLYDRVLYPKFDQSAVFLEFEYDFMYTRARQRWYSDNRLDHIRVQTWK